MKMRAMYESKHWEIICISRRDHNFYFNLISMILFEYHKLLMHSSGETTIPFTHSYIDEIFGFPFNL